MKIIKRRQSPVAAPRRGVVASKPELRKKKPVRGQPRRISLPHTKTAQAKASAEWEAKLHDSEDVLERMLDEAEAFRAERNARKAALKPA